MRNKVKRKSLRMVILKFNWVRNKSEKENYLKVGDRHRQI